MHATQSSSRLALAFLALAAFFTAGCQTAPQRPHWETTVAIRYEAHPDDKEKVTAELSMKTSNPVTDAKK
jgi:hypothetical protein